jgi:hypothetical protein
VYNDGHVDKLFIRLFTQKMADQLEGLYSATGCAPEQLSVGVEQLSRTHALPCQHYWLSQWPGWQPTEQIRVLQFDDSARYLAPSIQGC